jgi:hypothetical protein
MGELVDEPVERGRRRHRHRVAVPVFQHLCDQGHQGADGAFGAAAAAAQHVLDRRRDAFVDTARGAGCAGGAVVDQPPQALLAVGQAHALHRGPRDLPEPDRGQLVGLGLLALRECPPVRIVLLAYRSGTAGPVGQAALHFADVAEPGDRFVPGGGRGGLEQPPPRRGLSRGCVRAHDGEAGVGE